MHTRGAHSAVAISRKPKVAAPSFGGGKHAAGAVVATHALNLVKFAFTLCAAFGLIACIGIGFASAGNYLSASNVSSTEFTAQGAASASETHPLADGATSGVSNTSNEGFILETSAYRNMESAISEVEYIEEQERIAAEEAARAAEEAAIQQAQSAQAKSAANGGVDMYGVDFSIGREAFIAEWTDRINAYLAGSPLAGYGEDFATAAWENGIDPRWSPAISNTESTKGANCFLPHNAWGWTNGSWSSWTSAIYAHAKGLRNIYGFTISYANAKRYCPPNYDNWYRNTLNEMAKI